MPEMEKPGTSGVLLGNKLCWMARASSASPVQLFPPVLFLAKPAGIVHRDRNITAQSLKKPELLGRKSVELIMRGGKNADQLAIDMKRDGNFGKGGLFAANVVRILAHVGGIAHLAGSGDVSHHSLLANFQAMAITMNSAAGTAVRAGQFQFPAFPVVQVDVGINAAERPGNIVHDLIDKFVEIEDGRNALGCLLQFQQVFDLCNRQPICCKRSAHR